MISLLRFADLQARRIVNSWPQLKRLQKFHGFPLGRMLSPNIRAWTEEEIDAYYASRPVENARPLQGSPKVRHERRKAGEAASGGPSEAA
jgi:hypothetical protein